MEDWYLQRQGLTGTPGNKHHLNVLLGNKEKLTIGRKAGGIVDIVCSGKTVSRVHCILKYVDNCWQVEDLESMNGVYVNRIKITSNTPTPLALGDVLGVGAIDTSEEDYHVFDVCKTVIKDENENLNEGVLLVPPVNVGNNIEIQINKISNCNIPETYEEALKKRGKAVSSENLETSDAEQSKKSRSKRKTKTVFDPSCVIKRAKDFKRILPRVESSSDEDSPRAPTPPTLNTELILDDLESIHTPNHHRSCTSSSVERPATKRSKSKSAERPGRNIFSEFPYSPDRNVEPSTSSSSRELVSARRLCSKSAERPGRNIPSESLISPSRHHEPSNFSTLDDFVQRSMVKLNRGILDSEKLTAGVFEKLDRLESKMAQLTDQDNEAGDWSGYPINSMMDFDVLNEELKKIAQKKSLKTKLMKIGGSNPGNVVRNMLTRTISKDIGQKLSWYGKKGNIALGSTLLGETIISASVGCPSFNITETMAIQACQNWLRHLKDKPVTRRLM